MVAQLYEPDSGCPVFRNIRAKQTTGKMGSGKDPLGGLLPRFVGGGVNYGRTRTKFFWLNTACDICWVFRLNVQKGYDRGIRGWMGSQWKR